jgi:hypothetical protein
MSGFERPIPIRGDDVQGHAFDADSEADRSEEVEDTEGHRRRFAEAEKTEDDDVEGHVYVNESSPQGGRIGS